MSTCAVRRLELFMQKCNHPCNILGKSPDCQRILEKRDKDRSNVLHKVICMADNYCRCKPCNVSHKFSIAVCDWQLYQLQAPMGTTKKAGHHKGLKGPSQKGA